MNKLGGDEYIDMGFFGLISMSVTSMHLTRQGRSRRNNLQPYSISTRLRPFYRLPVSLHSRSWQ